MRSSRPIKLRCSQTADTRFKCRKQVGEGWTCHTQPEESIEGWLKHHMAQGTVGIDGHLITLSGWRHLGKVITVFCDAQIAVENPIDAIWADRPASPSDPAWTYPDVYAGKAAPTRLRLWWRLNGC